ncbi:MAG: hypothetical protein WBK88_03545, partial [Methanothrix sp.]
MMIKAAVSKGRPGSAPKAGGSAGAGAVSIDAAGLETRELNDRLRELLLSGVKRVEISHVCGQRYIGTRLYTPERQLMEIDIFGTAGNDLAAFLSGHKITV